ARAAGDRVAAALERRGRAIAAATARSSRLTALDEALARIGAENAEIVAQHAAAEAKRVALPDAAADIAAAGVRRAHLAELRAAQSSAQTALDEIRRGEALGLAREESTAAETAGWQRRAAQAIEHGSTLAARRGETEARLVELRQRPAALARERDRLLSASETAEAEQRGAADALAAAEAELAAAVQGARAARGALAAAREESVRSESELARAHEQVGAIVARMREALDASPEATRALAELKEGETASEPMALEARLERLKRERENMGPVNLRAEAEAAEIEAQFETLRSERADLEAAIARLRQGINSLNREGRARLMAAFDTVNAHFGALFERLFGGGQAHLALVESDDPLQAGLEIMASPPGKRLQVLSLLSGGEQALTALALLFGVFLTHPAPICVLDEVDAPLDDSNVGRFCELVREIARTTGTRFVIVTHHPITMAHMDRLFGVTMIERGVSQMVSVDLTRAVDLRAAE
ncbi:MAG: hypothetical protein FJX56_13200, partial [Alphaproteobacteria bacterium]|nr:hypothetical protein [Alphaproteobacteria bacterium]